jgi:hypothetical protein
MIQNTILCVILSAFQRAHFNPLEYATYYRNATKKAARHTLAFTQTYTFRVENVFNTQINLEQILLSVIYLSSIGTVLQETWTPCYDLPKLLTFPS